MTTMLNDLAVTGVDVGTDRAAQPLTAEELGKIHAYWRACNYLAAGMIYLRDNPLLREPLKPEHVKERLLGHWGASPGLSFAYIHLNRLINKYDLDAIFLAGPGHGRPACWRRSTSKARTPRSTRTRPRTRRGMRRFFKEFSFPGGIGSHCTPETPGSIHEGGELGYALSHAFGAAFDNPDLLVAVGRRRRRIGDRAAGDALALNKFLNPIRDGAVLPILHLNGYKINNPTICARIPHEELESLFAGYGWTPYFVEGSDPETMHQEMAATMDKCVAEIRRIQKEARSSGKPFAPALADDRAAHARRAGPARRKSDGHKVEGFWRVAPGAAGRTCTKDPAHLKQLEDWLRSYKPEELFDEDGRLIAGAEGARPEGHAAHRRRTRTPTAGS